MSRAALEMASDHQRAQRLLAYNRQLKIVSPVLGALGIISQGHRTIDAMSKVELMHKGGIRRCVEAWCPRTAIEEHQDCAFAPAPYCLSLIGIRRYLGLVCLVVS